LPATDPTTLRQRHHHFDWYVCSVTLESLRSALTLCTFCTAFIHLLSHAFTMFADPCLGNLAYDPAPGAIAMGAFMVVFAIDFLAARRMYQASCEAEEKDSVKAKTQQNRTRQSAERPVLFGHDHDFSQLQLEASATGGFGEDRKARWEVEMLEAGIIFHSVMIGESSFSISLRQRKC